jgi:hypothetical protein
VAYLQKPTKELMTRFQVKDLGEVKHVLGMRIRRQGDAVYVEQVLERFGLNERKPHMKWELSCLRVEVVMKNCLIGGW